MNPLPFTFHFDNSVSVYDRTIAYIEENEAINTDLFELAWAFHSIGISIPQTMDNYWSGHYFPFSESFEEFEVSYLLCSQGFYKQSMTSLRAVLETGLLSAYYNINDEGHKTVQGWLLSAEGKQNATPLFKTIWNILIDHPNISKFQSLYDLKSDLLSLDYLHNYVHSKGAKIFQSNRAYKTEYPDV